MTSGNAASSPLTPDRCVPSSLELRTFGRCRLVRRNESGEHVVYEGANKALALFTYLACAPARGASRAHLQELLWGRRQPELAQGALRTYIWKLRKELGADAIRGDEFLTLNVPCDVDRDQLIQAANNGDAAAVVATFVGDFYPAYAQPDSPEFDEWVQGERLRLRGMFMRCAERVVSAAIDTGRFRDALSLARRARDLDPLDETGWRLLLNVLIVSGDSLNAIAEATNLEQLLAAEEREPLPATAALLQAARKANRREVASDDAAPSLVAPLVGRDHEFTALTSAWALARTGRLTHVHVRGDAGMGKTRLLEDFTNRLLRDKSSVARARANMGRRSLPYAFVGSVASSLASKRGARGLSVGSASALLAINPTLSAYYPGEPDATTADEALRRRTLALHELIAAVCEERPLALVLDDLQWADVTSCAVIAGAIAGLESHRCLLVTASRDALPAALACPAGNVLTLAGLDREGVTELVQSLAALPDDAWAQQLPALLHHTTAGLPLHILDALVLAMERAQLSRDGQRWHAPHPPALQILLTQGATLPRRIESLSSEARELLLVLAVAGEPCVLDRLAGSPWISPMDVLEVSASLEHAGYVTNADGRCTITHDSVIDAVLSLAGNAERRRAHAALAHAILSGAAKQGDTLARVRLRSAISHAVRSENVECVRASFSAYVARARRLGDTRSLSWIAADALGDLDAPETRRLLLSAIPQRQRVLLGLRSRWRLATTFASIALIAGTSGAYLAKRSPTLVPDGELTYWQSDSVEARFYAQPISSRNWDPATPIDMHSAHLILSLPNASFYGDARPTGRSEDEWIVSMPQPDSGVTDLFLVNGNATPRRLTAARGDDLEPSMSPDGRFAVFTSARWSALAARSLAIIDLNTAAVTRLTSSPGSDDVPIWSPDGGRIAFVRRTADADVICVTTVDGHAVNCPTLPRQTGTVSPLAWQNDSILLIVLNEQLVRMHVDSSTITVIDSVRASRDASRDGRWIASSLRLTPGDVTRCFVSPLSELRRPREVRLPAEAVSPCASLMNSIMPRPSRHFVDTLRLVREKGDPVVTAPYQFALIALDAGGDTMRLKSVEWTSSDTLVATIDRNGLLRPRQPGLVTIQVSYGGWRSDRRRMHVGPAHSAVVLTEDWKDSTAPAWKFFGSPRPRIVSLADSERAFLNNGDGVFQSGAHSAGTFPVHNGLALDTWLSAPITMQQWQVIRIGLYGGVDSVNLAGWNHVDGWAFAPGRASTAQCDFNYPDGAEGKRSFAEAFAAAGIAGRALPQWRTGTRFHLRLQVFPDGRCGAAVDGHAIGIRETVGGWRNKTARVYLFGNSPNTQMLVGPVTITEGVPPGVDWFAESTALAAPGLSSGPRPAPGKRQVKHD